MKTPRRRFKGDPGTPSLTPRSLRENGDPRGEKREDGSGRGPSTSPPTEGRGPEKDRRGGHPPRREGPRINRTFRSLALWVVLTLLLLTVYKMYQTGRKAEAEITYTQFIQEVEKGNIRSAMIVEKEVSGVFREPSLVTTGEGLPPREVDAFKVWLPAADEKLPDRIWEKSPDAAIRSKPEGMNWFSILLSWLPILLILGFWIFIVRQMQGGGNKAFSFGKSRARLLTADRPKVTFADVAGATEAKEELQEIIDFLRRPEKFQKLGGRIPKGALLLGPPGTGKTLLAKAVAGEAEVPFFSMSGSDFVEMFVGVGASRVRDLFEQGKRNAPCIIFIDEIDAVGRHRGAGLGGGHDEREQTLNQLLVEMDGFESKEGVILLAATNRPDVLDPALLRPGRFDRQIVVDMPDVAGREGILKVHTRNIPLEEGIDLKVLARGTPGLSGADLANLVNEAALLAARRNRDRVSMLDFEDAKDKVMMGMERKSLFVSDKEKRGTAYHEAGHALVAILLPNADPLHKVSIIPRGQALGVTHLLPMDEKHKWSREYCLDYVALTMGGRAAESMIFGELTTGARDDIEKATTLARKMVCEWGMSERLGPLTFGHKEEQIFLGREIARHRDYSEKTAELIDEEVRAIVETQYDRALTLLKENRETLIRIGETLLEREVLDGDEIARLARGEELDPLPHRRKTRAERDTGRPEKSAAPAAREEGSAPPPAPSPA
ncbi:MAG: ATP-dependent zinc metalloprotease FtsH [Candidatus Eisenbacteria bacterium]|nr:ATP-dependent zinc metalloprotease FtsH [Candidatus Eisenbacteria bacterium]